MAQMSMFHSSPLGWACVWLWWCIVSGWQRWRLVFPTCLAKIASYHRALKLNGRQDHPLVPHDPLQLSAWSLVLEILFLVNNNIQESENIFSIHTESLDRSACMFCYSSSYHRSPVYTECSAALPAIIPLSLITKMLAYSSLKSGTREHLRLIIMEARL